MVTIADTAFSIAAVRAEERRRPESDRLFDDPFAACFREGGAHAEEGTQRYLALPFFRDGVRLRTRFIDDALREGLGAGLDQVVLLGAGFDARGLRMPEIAALRATVYEVDTREQLERKRAMLESAGVRIPPEVRYVPIDFEPSHFEEALTAGLEAQGFRAGAGALFVWEGVIGYIDDAAIERSLRFMVRAGGARSRLVFTFYEGCFGAETCAERLARAGFSSCDELGLDEVWRRYLPGEPPPSAGLSRIGTAAVAAPA